STPVILELRIRACHVYGSFATRDNVRATWSARDRLAEPASFDYGRLAHPPVTFHQEADKVDRRLPAARRFIVERGLNERFGPAAGRVGII
ncbi:hypothetical protein ABTK84_19480, partial [Acinetobacter baumannii]